MAANNNNTFEQVYNVQEDEALLPKVAFVVCVVVQRGLMSAGFNASRELLTIHFTSYNKHKPVWDLDFFEHLLTQEPLLALRDKVKGIFMCCESNLIVPDALYDEKEAKNWLKHIHFVEARETIEVFPLEEDKAKYLHAVPIKIAELLKINFKKVPVLPLATYQFRNSRQQSLNLQCSLSSDQVCVTLHNYSQLLWHRVFEYSCAEDVAYMIKHLCMENNISPSKINMMCNALSGAEQPVLNELSQYFTGMKAGNGTLITGQWDAAASLANQLLACV